MTDTEKQLRSRLGASLRKARQDKGLTQAELAEVVETDPETISRFERGATLPSLVRLLALADALGLTMSTLLGAASPHARDEWENLFRSLDALAPSDQKLAAALVKTVIDERKK